jgi:regulator of sirC expression with transglutaminase-like and TPR domain
MSTFGANVEFNKLRAGRDDVDLVELMLELARDAYPRLEPAIYRREIARLRQLASLCLRDAGQTLAARLDAISNLLYVKEGFRGNREAYYDPRNSYLNEVLDRRLGIPISLGIVYMAVAAGAAVAVWGVPTPGHFMLAAEDESRRWFIDPFSGGQFFDEAGCRRHLATMLGSAAVADGCLRRASNHEIVVRVLRNLKAAHAMDDAWQSALPVQQRLAALLPDNPEEQRDLALVYLRSGHPHPALDLLNNYAAACNEERARLVEPYLRIARRMVAELN